jgi:ectoine hydroxylase-related dioxygenase (phytanoyl-CoA dioxygenase family)
MVNCRLPLLAIGHGGTIRAVLRNGLGKEKRMTLTDDQLASWENNGYLVLPGFFQHREISAIDDAEARVWATRHPDVVVDDLFTSTRKKLCRVSDADRRNHIFKVNDLYLCEPVMRETALHSRLAAILQRLIGDTPVLCNTLSFTRGSQQPEHIDSLYMTPRTPNHLAATWIALEDCHPDAGPLFYYPGSHRIPLYLFSDGSHHWIQDEGDAWTKYILGKLSVGNYQRESFAAKRGDVFIWHANLVHGGSAINDESRTRRSLVSHYFTVTDCRAMNLDCQPLNGAYWMQRPHQAVPEDRPNILRRAVARVWRTALRRAS